MRALLFKLLIALILLCLTEFLIQLLFHLWIESGCGC